MNGVLASAVAGQTATIGTAAGAQVSLLNTIFANSSGGVDFVNNRSTVTGDHTLATQTTGPPIGINSTTTALLNLAALTDHGGPTKSIALKDFRCI